MVMNYVSLRKPLFVALLLQAQPIDPTNDHVRLTMSSKVLIRSLGFPVRRAEVPLIVHRANPDSDGEVDLPTFRLISKSDSCDCIW